MHLWTQPTTKPIEMIYALLLSATLNLQPVLELNKPLRNTKTKAITSKVFRGLITATIVVGVFVYNKEKW